MFLKAALTLFSNTKNFSLGFVDDMASYLFNFHHRINPTTTKVDESIIFLESSYPPVINVDSSLVSTACFNLGLTFDLGMPSASSISKTICKKVSKAINKLFGQTAQSASSISQPTLNLL